MCASEIKKVNIEGKKENGLSDVAINHFHGNIEAPLLVRGASE